MPRISAFISASTCDSKSLTLNAEMANFSGLCGSVAQFIGWMAFNGMSPNLGVYGVRTDQRHSRENGNPWIARLSRWIPACAGMTGKWPKLS